MKLFNSKSGFTLIELLVVIGILAVLAAIAIPSVAGLIDRANVSADKTNANEMTNAVERFAAEYELYCQDIASGVITASTADFDAAQGRVYNVTGITDRDGVTAFESETGFGGKGINRDTKYPVNEATLKSIVENYTKTSSATFTPKQSDHEFYYTPEAGLVIVAEQGSTVDQLNSVAFASEDDIAQFDTVTWICLDGEVDNIATDEEGIFGELQNTERASILTFTVEDAYGNPQTFQFKEGMTWGQWINSEYNTDGFTVMESRDYGDVVECAGRGYLFEDSIINALNISGNWVDAKAWVTLNQTIYDTMEYVYFINPDVLGMIYQNPLQSGPEASGGYYYFRNDDGTVDRIPINEYRA